MKKIIHLTVFLAIIAALAGAALGFANSVTAPVIAENALKAERETLKVIYDLPDEAFKVEKENVSKTILKIFKVVRSHRCSVARVGSASIQSKRKSRECKPKNHHRAASAYSRSSVGES